MVSARVPAPLRVSATLLVGVLCTSCADHLRYNAGRPSTFPDGTRIVLGSDRDTDGDVYVVGVDGTGLSRLTTGPLVKGWPAVSPDGHSIVYATESEPSGPWHIFAMGSDGRHATQLTFGHESDVAPSYSPDGKEIVFARAERRRPYSMGGFIWDQWDIWMMRADGSAQRRLTSQQHYSLDPPYISPDGKRVLFAATPASARGLRNHIYTLDLGSDADMANSGELPTDHLADYEGQPRFSNDGLHIAFISRTGSRDGLFDYEVWIAEADGTKRRPLTHNQSMNSYPAFSPDNQFIYFLSDPGRNGLRRLWKIEANGTGAASLLLK